MDVIERNKELGKAKLSLGKNTSGAFLTPILCSVDIIWNNTIPTGATDGKVIYINENFFDELTPKQRVFLIAHEIWHIALMHMHRLGSRNPQIWNMAADYVINALLIKENYEFIPEGLYSDEYENMTTEAIYDLLINNAANPEDIIPDGYISDISYNSLDTGERLNNKDKIANAQKIITANIIAKDCIKNIGSISEEITSVLDQFLNPIIPWQVVLHDFFNEISSDDFSYRRPSRRSDEFILPSMFSENKLEHLVYCVDVSGSISDEEIQRFNSELKHIKDAFNPKLLTIIQFNTKITNITVFEEEDSFDKIKIIGRGGTNLEAVVTHVNKLDASAVIIFTDLYVDIPKKPINKPVIWVVSNSDIKEVPYGKVISIKNDKVVK